MCWKGKLMRNGGEKGVSLGLGRGFELGLVSKCWGLEWNGEPEASGEAGKMRPGGEDLGDLLRLKASRMGFGGHLEPNEWVWLDKRDRKSRKWSFFFYVFLSKIPGIPPGKWRKCPKNTKNGKKKDFSWFCDPKNKQKWQKNKQRWQKWKKKWPRVVQKWQNFGFLGFFFSLTDSSRLVLDFLH